MSSEEDVYKPIHFRPSRRLAETLQTYMGIHKLGNNKTEAIHGILEEWIILTEQQKAYLDDSKPRKLTFDVPCDYRGQDDKRQPFCRNKKAPIITKFLCPEACEHCLKIRITGLEVVYGYCNVCKTVEAKTIIREVIPKVQCKICGTVALLNLV